jgi:hypothetical protein
LSGRKSKGIQTVKIMTRSVTLKLGAIAIDALGGETKGGAEPSSEDLMRAVRLYLNDKDRAGTGWTYPRFLRDRNAKGFEFELSLEDSLWISLEREAEDQGVTIPELLEHAALYYAAELDAGRVAERLLEEDL